MAASPKSTGPVFTNNLQLDQVYSSPASTGDSWVCHLFLGQVKLGENTWGKYNLANRDLETVKWNRSLWKTNNAAFWQEHYGIFFMLIAHEEAFAKQFYSFN